MTIDMTRHQGDTGLPVIECTDTRRRVYRVRTDFQPYNHEDGTDGTEKQGMTFIETEFPYKPTMAEVRDFCLGVIDQQTAQAILSGLEWQGKRVWLSIENQLNFAAAERRALANADLLPMDVKIGETDSGESIRHTFQNQEALTLFVTACQEHIEQCRQAGQQRKDGFDFTEYAEALGIATEE